MWTKTIQSVAEQLCTILKDYDVSYEVAQYYVQKRVEDSTEECRRHHFDYLTLRKMPGRMRSVSSTRWERNNTFLAMIQFMGSERGMRSPYWRVAAAAMGIKDLDKEKITIRDKLNDIEIIRLDNHRLGSAGWP